MNLDLQTGDKVTWKVGVFIMVGAVLEDHGEGEVEVITHTRNGGQHNQTTFVNKSKLTLMY
tara:strand:+ start:4051 stop:4233 length:183 start_codon:yes stop_codon:yes gene_type:complete